MRSPFFVLSVGAVSFGALAGCSTLTPTDDPVYLRLNDLEARLMRIERVVNNESLIELAGQIEQLRADTQALRGEVETLRHETETAGERQRELYLDIDQRLQALEQARARGPALGGGAGQDELGDLGGPGSPGGLPQVGEAGSSDAQGGSTAATGGEAQPGSGPSANDQDEYQAAFDLIQARRYEDAAQAFRRFLAAFPDSSLADNAQYWLGETQYVQREFAAALEEFQKVIDEYPQSDKIADALLKVGYCNYELERWDAARSTLQQVMRDYPNTTAARLAVTRLERLEQETG